MGQLEGQGEGGPNRRGSSLTENLMLIERRFFIEVSKFYYYSLWFESTGDVNNFADSIDFNKRNISIDLNDK